MPNGQFPTVLAGQVITAALLQQMPLFYMRKDADTPRSNTTTVAADPDLQFTVVSGGIYHIFGWVTATGAAISAGDLKATVVGPTSSTGIWTMTGYLTSGTTFNLNATRNLASTNAVGVNGATFSSAFVFASVTAGSAGSIQFQWAQNSSNATATTLKAGSWLLALRSA